MLSWRMLVDEVGAVEAALRQSLSAGRERLSWLVSRETASLSESQVRENVSETLAGNLYNDSVSDPADFLVRAVRLAGRGGVPLRQHGDAMWGYRGRPWEWAGKWAARADDALSWLPARLTAWLLMGVTRQVRFGALRREAARTPSPNSGWPMAAMAMALGVSLGKPGVYTLNATGHSPQASDVPLAQKNASKVVFALVPCALTAIVLVALVM